MLPLVSEARMATARARRYLARLCKHFEHVQRFACREELMICRIRGL
jgi:hypothetical protein